jgi:hypothetical protein
VIVARSVSACGPKKMIDAAEADRASAVRSKARVVMSETTYRASGVDWAAERKSLQLKGYEVPIDARVFRSESAVSA